MFGELSEHVFINAQDFLTEKDGVLAGECMAHSFGQCTFEQLEEFQVDILFVTCSCRPYSKTTPGRGSGTFQHEDSWHIEAFFNVWKKTKAKAVIMEQVFGFALPESDKDRLSPLRKMLDRIETEFAAWSVTVYIAHGNTFLIFVRHRFYTVALHECGGGVGTSHMLKRVVSVPREFKIG